MENAKIFNNGGSQAVRLPKECRFDDNEVNINHIGDIVILSPKDHKWDNFFAGIDMLSEDFMKDNKKMEAEDIVL